MCENTYVASLIAVAVYNRSSETDRMTNMFSLTVFDMLIIFFTGLNSVNLSLWWGIALKSQQTAINTIAFIVELECRKTMKIT